MNAQGLGAAVAAIAVLVTAGTAGTAEAKKPQPGCKGGVTLFLDGPLRIVADPYQQDDGTGADYYACLGSAGRPVSVGGMFRGTGVALSDTLQYAFAGGRYLGVEIRTDSEGGPDGEYDAVDLKTRKAIVYAQASPSFQLPVQPLRMTSFGDLLGVDFQVDGGNPVRVQKRFVKRGDGVNVSAGNVIATEVALVGTTAYWSEDAGTPDVLAGSATVRGHATDPEAHLLTPVSVPVRNACALRPGAAVAASPHVRVYVPKGSTARYLCRAGRTAPVRLAAAQGTLQIVNDRWLLTRTPAGPTGQQLAVIDSTTRRTVTTVAVPAAATEAAVTLTDDGSLAWRPAGGDLLVQKPADDAPTVLAAAAEGATALASSRSTIYWTAGARPHRFETVPTPPPDR